MSQAVRCQGAAGLGWAGLGRSPRGAVGVVLAFAGVLSEHNKWEAGLGGCEEGEYSLPSCGALCKLLLGLSVNVARSVSGFVFLLCFSISSLYLIDVGENAQGMPCLHHSQNAVGLSHRTQMKDALQGQPLVKEGGSPGEAEHPCCSPQQQFLSLLLAAWESGTPLISSCGQGFPHVCTTASRWPCRAMLHRSDTGIGWAGVGATAPGEGGLQGAPPALRSVSRS